MNSCEKVIGTVQPTLKIIGSVESSIGGGGGGGQDGVSPIVEITPIVGGNRLTITDVNGAHYADIMNGKNGKDGSNGYTPQKGVDYFDGKNGSDGVSPTVSVSKSGKVTTVSITDKNGTKTATINDGSDGASGKDGSNGVSATHSWNGTTLTVTSASGTSSANLKGDKGDKGDTGSNGSNGVGIKSVVQTTTSSADGGNNIITVTKTDNTTSTFTVKNGSKGSKGDKGDTGAQGIQGIQGEKGADGAKGDKGDKGDTGATGAAGKDGKTPVKGVDYFTEADKAEIVAAVIESLGGNPIFGIVDENNNIIVNGYLPDGTYTVKYEMEGGKIINIGNLVLDTNVYYTVTKNLTNCTISNSATQAVQGGSYSATISANDGFELKSVSVTMGGSPVTVTGGNISIANVTGDIVITAVAEEATVEINNLAQPDATATGEAAWNSGGWCNNSYMAGSSYAYRSATDGRLTTNTIAVEHGDTIYVKGINYADATAPQVALFDSSGNRIWHGHVKNAAANSYINGLVSTVGEDYWSFKNHGNLESTDRGVRFVRFAGYPSGDISDIIITRNQPIE